MIHRIGFIILALTSIAVGLVVGTLNSESVTVDLLWLQVEWPLGLVMIVAMLLGLGLGVSLTWLLAVLPARMRLRRLRGAAGSSPSSANDA